MAISTISAAQAVTYPGAVLQVVNATYTGYTSTTNTTFTSTPLTASITPKSSTSKILIIATGVLFNNGATGYTFATLYRNSTNLGGSSGMSAQAGVYDVPTAMSYLDSPATTSATTYTVYIKAQSGTTGFIGDTNLTNVITLLEVAA